MNYLGVRISKAYGSYLAVEDAGTNVRGLGLAPGGQRWL